MDTEVTTIYCITDDWLQARRHQESSQRKVTDAEVIAEVITVAIAAARFFKGNFEKAWRWLVEGGYMTRRLSRSRFNRRLHAVSGLLETLFQRLAGHWKQTGEEDVFLVDSFPVEVCDNMRIPGCRIYQKEAFRGYIASKRRYFYGLKVHVLSNEEGRPVEAFLTPGSANDTGQLRNFEFDVPEGSVVYGDKAYNEYFTEDLLEQACGIDLSPIRKKNSTRKVPAYSRHLQQSFRKQIETAFSQITRLLPRSIHAVTAKGFELKVFLFVLAFSFDGLF